MRIERPVPSRADWGEIDTRDLDAQWAFDTFCGLSQEEAEALFTRNALYYQEALPSMPPAAFNFYAPVLASYITSRGARGDADGASSFLEMVAWMLQMNRRVMTPETEALLLATARRVTAGQAFYKANPEIYGDFREMQKRIDELLG